MGSGECGVHKGYSGTSWATSSNYSSYSSNSNSSSGLGVGRKTSYGGNLRDTSFEENEEYEYEENQRRKALNARNRRSRTPENITNLYASRAKKYSEYIDRDGGGVGDNYGRKNSDIGLNSMRKPKIHSWDNMGILGLTSKIWNDTKTRQETFMTSTGSFLREESMYQGVM